VLLRHPRSRRNHTYALRHLKTPFEEIRFSFSFGTPGDFSTIIRPEFDEAKASGALDASLGKVPYLEVDGVKIGQSKAIERFVAREVGLMGANNVEAFQIDQLCETLVDINQAYNKAKASEDKEAAMKKWFDEDLPNWCALAEKSIPAASTGPWLVGSKISLADVAWYQLLAAPKGFFDNTDGALAAFQGSPKIKAAMEATGANEELKTHIANRKETMF